MIPFKFIPTTQNKKLLNQSGLLEDSPRSKVLKFDYQRVNLISLGIMILNLDLFDKFQGLYIHLSRFKIFCIASEELGQLFCRNICHLVGGFDFFGPDEVQFGLIRRISRHLDTFGPIHKFLFLQKSSFSCFAGFTENSKF